MPVRLTVQIINPWKIISTEAFPRVDNIYRNPNCHVLLININTQKWHNRDNSSIYTDIIWSNPILIYMSITILHIWDGLAECGSPYGRSSADYCPYETIGPNVVFCSPGLAPGWFWPGMLAPGWWPYGGGYAGGYAGGIVVAVTDEDIEQQ